MHIVKALLVWILVKYSEIHRDVTLYQVSFNQNYMQHILIS